MKNLLDIFDTNILVYWFNAIAAMLPRLFVTIVVALVLIHFRWFRRSIAQAESAWIHRLVLIGVFGALGLYGTHNSIPIDRYSTHLDLSASVPHELSNSQAIIGFRDTWTLVAGLTGGLWVGLGPGLLVGIERYSLGGYAGLASGLATAMLGLYAGVVRQLRPQWINHSLGALFVVVLGTTLQGIIVLLMVPHIDDAAELDRKLSIPIAFVNTSGCILFLWIMRDLERDRWQIEIERNSKLAQQSEIRVLRAQVEPHFLNNTLNILNAYILKDSDKARDYVCDLARLLKFTREFAGHNTISLQQELEQLQRYLTLQNLCLDNKLQVTVEVPKHLLGLKVLPMCLVTLAENAIVHGFDSMPAPYELQVSAIEPDKVIVLSVRDNGVGIAPEQLIELGKSQVKSIKGGGVALQQLAQSLKWEFGDTAGLRFESSWQKGTVVFLSQPKLL